MRLKHNAERGRFAMFILWFVSPMLALLQGVQSTRLLIALYLPLIIVECGPVMLDIIRDNGHENKLVKKSTIFTIVCAVCNLVGVSIITVLIRQGIVLVEFTLVTTYLRATGYRELWGWFSLAVPQLFASLGLQGNVVVYTVAGLVHFGRIFVIITFPIIMRKTFAWINEDKAIVQVLFASVCALSIAMVITITGVGERFLFTIVALMGVITVMVLDCLVRNKRYALTAIICVVLFSIIGGSAYALNIENQEELVANRQLVADFIVEQGLSIGYGSFWDALVLTAVGDFAFDVIAMDMETLTTRPFGSTMERFHHNEDRVFVVLTWWQESAMRANDRNRAIFETATHHYLRNGWNVYIFEQNPF